MNMLYFILLSLFWGGSFLAINISLRAFAPFFAATLRILIALVFISIYIVFKKIPFAERKPTLMAIFNGFIGVGVPWALLFWGEQYIEPALCAIINATTGIYILIFTAIMIRAPEDRITWERLLGIILGVVGIAVIFVPSITDHSVNSILGLSAIIGMTICYGFSITYLKLYVDKMSNSMVLFWECMGALIVVLPLSIIYGFKGSDYSPDHLIESTIAVLYLGIFSTAIAFLLIYRLIKSEGVIKTAAIGYMIPIVSIALDWLVKMKTGTS